ncbi:transglutaminase family protein [Xinfangfangia sp. CPCC 101601]|uniref:Transglutaminase family protein n=1 Tax=Pseudogemmobacter lacusdianii TaxID=3069608 RepID=A0ABU0VVN3_9RHOB|nr:transglutaminase family protein [Xinfangfangia sp. CPCC 101601]MDQ2065810.1 transglutaminase family protein [Xinfangfangia sp. CPCC 101601]
MLLDVDHLSLYRYAAPVRSVVQSHRLTPSRCASQKVVQWEVQVSGATKGAGFTDGAGDAIQAWTVSGPVTEVAVTVRGRVETSDTAGVLRSHRESAPPEVYLRDTPATALDGALRDLAAGVPGGETLSMCHDLSHAVAEAIAYRPGTTTGRTTAAEALAQGMGVCQDHAHALIACARVHEVPARYVSGYLFADASGAAHEAAHAWAELFVPGLGWVGFDPANRCCPDDRYIRLGSGFDASAAAPIRGIARGMAGDGALDVRLSVVAAQQ